MERILVTGASSYVGARIYSDLKKNFDVIGTYNNTKLFQELVKLDITKNKDVIATIEKIKPEVVVHVAANPSASWCEINPALAKKINEGGTKNIVKATNKVNARIIYISSFSAINPATTYGKTKLAGEEFVKKTKAGFNILRPSLILGFSPNTANDRPFNRLLKNITEKTPAIYDTSWKFQPMWIGQISEIIQIIIKKGISGETIPISVPGLKTKFEIAKDILQSFGIEVTPKDLRDNSKVVIETQEKLKQLNLPQYSYNEIIKKIKEEITEYLNENKS